MTSRNMNDSRKHTAIIAAILSVTAFIVSCHDGKGSGREPVPVRHELTLTLEPGRWIYYSITDSTVVGRSPIGDDAQDAEWGGRTDWDIALSESGIRTNSGTSGRGKGGLALISDSLYDTESENPLMTLDYHTDTLGVTVIRPLTGQ